MVIYQQLTHKISPEKGEVQEAICLEVQSLVTIVPVITILYAKPLYIGPKYIEGLYYSGIFPSFSTQNQNCHEIMTNQ